MKKQILIPILSAGVIVLVAGAAVGGFFGGKAYERNRADTIRNDFMRERGIVGFDTNMAPGAGMNQSQGAAPNENMNTGNFPAGGMGRGASGEVKSVDGNTLTLTTGENETKVTLSDNTTIVKTISGSTADLTAGQQVMVTGERDSDGNITATQVTILNGSQSPSGATP